jgi:hypothetical protein
MLFGSARKKIFQLKGGVLVRKETERAEAFCFALQ